MSTPSAFTPDQMRRIDHHVRELSREIEAQCAEHRDVIGHALAVIARAAHPEAESVVVPVISQDGTFGPLLCTAGDLTEQLPEAAVSGTLVDELVRMLRRLPHSSTGTAGVWTWGATGATLDVPAAVARGDRYPFLPVQDRLVARVESTTGRSVRSIEIASELFDNGYYFCDTVQVDYRDGDSDDVYIDDLADFAADLEHVAGSPGPRTLVTIECTSAGITID